MGQLLKEYLISWGPKARNPRFRRGFLGLGGIAGTYAWSPFRLARTVFPQLLLRLFGRLRLEERRVMASP
jgi:hypothetical protein